jgi:hypothetical protein
MSDREPISTNGIMWVIGIALTLIIWALQLLGLVESKWFGLSLLCISLVLLIVSFWRWKQTHQLPAIFKSFFVIMFVAIYCGCTALVLGYARAPKLLSGAEERQHQSEARPNPIKAPEDQSTLNHPLVITSQNSRAPSAHGGSSVHSGQANKPAVLSGIQPNNNTNPTQSCPNGICIGGDNFGVAQVINQPAPIVLTDAESAAVASGMANYAGTKIILMTDGVNDETTETLDKLAAALDQAGLIVDKRPSMMTMMSNGRRPPPGISFGIPPGSDAVAQQMAKILLDAGFLPQNGKFVADRIPASMDLVIMIGSTIH